MKLLSSGPRDVDYIDISKNKSILTGVTDY